MRKLESLGHIKDGKLFIHYRNKFDIALKTFDDCNVKIKIEKIFHKRSTKTYKDDGSEGLGQNGYYWKIIVPCFINGYFETQGIQITIKQAHENLKELCNTRTIVNKQTGELKDIGVSTADLTTIQFEEFTERCRQFIFEWFNITVPLPNEQSSIEFK